MKLMPTAAICLAILYFADAYYSDGMYFHALQEMTAQLFRGY
jgi:hypothetical protein